MLSSIIFVLALSLPFSVAAAPPRRDESLHIPLIRRRSNVQRNFVDVNHYAGVASNMRAKYNFAPSSPSRRAQTTDVGITNQVRFSSATDSRVQLTLFNTTRAKIRVTSPKAPSALRECETLSFTLSLIVFFTDPRNSISSLTPAPQICGLPSPAAPDARRAPQR